jgi:hypothetical protein
VFLLASFPARAAGKHRACVAACGARIADCSNTCATFANLAKSCRKQVLKRCAREGLATCSGGATTTTTTTLPCVSGVQARHYVANQITLPVSRSMLALDLDGNGTADNAFGNVIGAFAAQNLDVQAELDAAIAAGTQVTLIAAISSDSTFQNDGCARVILLAGQDTALTFDGSDQVTVDGSVLPATFVGALASGTFTAALPPTAMPPVNLIFPLRLFGAEVRLPIVGAHVQFTVTGSGLAQGEIHGAIRATDVQGQVFPALAASLTAVIAADPSSSTAMALEQIFDTGGTADPACAGTCRNADASCATASDRVIATCEVSTNSVTQAVFAPDLDLFDGDMYAPNPAPTVKDSLSVGLGFSAVPASF